MECALCQLSVKKALTVDGLFFCCPGCLAVHRIIKSKNEEELGRNHPLLKEALRNGIISNPDLIEELNSKHFADTPYFRITLEVNDLFCPSCQELIEWCLKKKRGVKSAHVDYATDLAFIEYFPEQISKEEIVDQIRLLGYTPNYLEDRGQKKEEKNLNFYTYLSAFFALNVMMFSYPIYIALLDGDQEWGHFFAKLSLVFSMPCLLIGYPLYKRAYNGLINGFFGMEFLATSAIFCATIVSTWNLFHGSLHLYFDAMTTLVTLLLFGRLLEQKAKFRAKETLFSIHRSMPKRGRKIFADGQMGFCLLKEVEVGDSLKALHGEKIVLDGVVVEGEALVVESMLTGEVMPVQKRRGDSLFAGTYLQQGWLDYKVTKKEAETTFAEIIGWIEGGLKQKSHSRVRVDKILHWFIPLILLCCLMLALFLPTKESLYRILTLLMIACPCAIGIAVPLGEAKLIAALSRIGIFVKNRGALEFLGKEDIFIFDKTGTVTEGAFTVTSDLSKLTSCQLSILKAICLHSTHPVSVSILSSLTDVVAAKLSEVVEVMGKGVRAKFMDRSYYLGSHRWFKELSLGEVESKGVEVLFLEEGSSIFPITLKDKIKEGISPLLNSLKHTLLLSGDRKEVVEPLASLLGFSSWQAEVSPLEKQEFVKRFIQENKVVAMVGDGINDAPALSAASLSFAPLNATDLSLHSADFLLQTPKIFSIREALNYGAFTRKIVKQNLFWAFIYNGIGVLLACFGQLHPLYSAFAMVASSLLVTLNSMRIRSLP